MSWQFRWSETRLDGKRLYHKKIAGTVEQYPDEDAARRSVVGLVSELNADGRPTNSGVLTVAQLCDHFEQRELSQDNTWRSHATKKIYQAYLSRWIRPHWQKYRVAAERDIRLKVGRYRLRERHDERHPFHRVRSGWAVQDRVIAKARANASDSRGLSGAVERTLYIHQARGLGFCK
jgi:hypothetical protein